MRVYRSLLALLLALVLAGCGGGDGAGTAATDEADTRATKEAETAAPEEAENPWLYGVDVKKGCPKATRPPRSLLVALDGWETPETAGILVANARGIFTDMGLEVSTLATVGPGSVIPAVVEGNDELGVSHEPEVVLAKEAGAPIVIVGSLIPRPTAAMIWLEKSKIRGIAGLRGKTIAVPGLPFQERFLERILARGGLTLDDVKVEKAGNELVPDLASGRADAIFGRWNLQGAELEARGLKPVITRVQSLGIPAYDELVLIARPDCLSEKPEVFRDFMAALSRGTAAAVEDPQGAADALRADYESNPETGRKSASSQFAATLPLLSRDAHVSPAQARGLVEWMHEEEMIERKPPPGKLLTNEFTGP